MEKNKIRITAALILLICNSWFCSILKAQGLDNIGYASFNITSPQFNCDGFISELNRLSSIHVSFLYNTFGNDFSCLERVVKLEKLKSLQIHLINEPGHRNSRLGSYEFLYSISTPKLYNSLILQENVELKNKFIEYVKPIQNFIDTQVSASTEVIISPGLESNLTSSAGKIIVNWTRELFPNRRISFNQYPNNSLAQLQTNSDFVESHGLFPKLTSPCIFNLDGADVSFPNRMALGEKSYREGQVKNWIQSGSPLFQLYEQYANLCEYVFIWTAESNGLADGAFVDPRQRNNNISTRIYTQIFSEISALNRLGKVYPLDSEYSEADLQIAKTCTIISTKFEDGAKRGNLLKQSEFRNRGAALILSNKFSRPTSVRLYKGRRIADTFTRVGNYKDGRILFRSSKSPTKYPFKTFLVIQEKNQKICYKLPNPRIRLD
jgi:hypothetical protein